jgi:hypothetical protein
MKRPALLAPLLLAGCGPVIPPPREPAALVPLPGAAFVEPDRIIGRDADSLIGLFGRPNLDVTEGTGRKLQFATTGCVLDAYLYPKPGSVPVVTYLDARQPDGTPADRGACISALGRRGRR